MFQSLIKGFKGLFAGSRPDHGLAPDYKERRKLVRLRCSYEVKGTLKDKKFKATIVDIGLQGLKLRTGQQLTVGDMVLLTPPNPSVGAAAEPVEGKIIWVKAPDRHFLTYAGAVFTADKATMARSWVKLFLKELGFSPKTIYSQRRFVRADCFLTAQFLVGTSPVEHAGRVYNLGVGGMLLETPQDLKIGEPIDMTLGPLDGLPPLQLRAVPVQSQMDGPMKLYGLEFQHGDDQGSLGVLGQYLQRLLKACWSE